MTRWMGLTAGWLKRELIDFWWITRQYPEYHIERWKDENKTKPGKGSEGKREKSYRKKSHKERRECVGQKQYLKS